jgi:hypothetical protein
MKSLLGGRSAQRLFNYIDGIAFFNQLLAPLEVEHEVDTSEKCRVLRQRVCKCISVLPALGLA